MGAVGKPIRYSIVSGHFSNCPEFLNRDLENPHLAQPRSTQPFHTDSHFSYANYGYYWSFIYLFSTFLTRRNQIAGLPKPHSAQAAQKILAGVLAKT